jgi:hypothetical protein
MQPTVVLAFENLLDGPMVRRIWVQVIARIKPGASRQPLCWIPSCRSSGGAADRRAIHSLLMSCSPRRPLFRRCGGSFPNRFSCCW